MVSKLNLDNVFETSNAKYCTVKYDKFKDWKSYFLNGLSKIGLQEQMLTTIEKDLKNLTNQKENTCIFQGRDFNENYKDTSSMFSI